MFGKILHFIKYNNAMVLILVFIFVAGSGVFAASETGQEFIGTEQKKVAGIDNTLLLEADLNNFDMGFKIEKIEEDEKYYYVTYTYFDLELKDDAWQYVLNEKIRKVSKKLKQDLGEYLAEELEEEYFARTAYLRKERQRAESEGEEVRQEVLEYSGLRGRFLKVGENIFPGYTAVKVRALPSPTLPPLLPTRKTADGEESDMSPSASADNITEVYEDYIARMDPDGDDVFGILDNCPETYNPDQTDSDGNGIGDACEDGSTVISDAENPDNENTGENGNEDTNETESETDGTSADTADENGEPETGTEAEGEDADGSAETGTDTEGETTDGSAESSVDTEGENADSGTDTNNATDPNEDTGDKSGDSEGSTDSGEESETTSEETAPSDASSDDYDTVEVMEYPESGNEEKSVE